MITRFLSIAALSLTLSSLSLSAHAEPAIASGAQATLDDAAPDFVLKDINGKAHRLSDYRGKTVVLEWFNPGCPFVVYAYEKGPLEELAAKQGKDIVWLNINSGAPGKQGASIEQNKEAASSWDIRQPVLLDPSGAVGKAFAAKTTPQMVVIDDQGVLRYNGALDNAPRGSGKAETYQSAFVDAIGALANGKKVQLQSTKPYGCSVKYAD